MDKRVGKVLAILAGIVVVAALAAGQNAGAASGIFDTIVYTGLGLLLSALGYFMIDVITPGDLGKSIKQDHNVSAAIVVAASMMSTAIIIASVMVS